MSPILNNATKNDLSGLTEELRYCGRKNHMLMFLQGKWGSGKMLLYFQLKDIVIYYINVYQWYTKK